MKRTFAAVVICASALMPSCGGPAPGPDPLFDTSTTRELWDIVYTSNDGRDRQTARVEVDYGSTGGGSIKSAGPPDWRVGAQGFACVDPLVISGNVSSGVSYSTFNFTARTKGTCGDLWSMQVTAYGRANDPSMSRANQANGTMFVSYQNRVIAGVSWSDTFGWTAAYRCRIGRDCP